MARPKKQVVRRLAPVEKTLVVRLRQSAQELKGSHHAEAASSAADRIEQLEQTLRQLERLIVGSF